MLNTVNLYKINVYCSTSLRLSDRNNKANSVCEFAPLNPIQLESGDPGDDRQYPDYRTNSRGNDDCVYKAMSVLFGQ